MNPPSPLTSSVRRPRRWCGSGVALASQLSPEQRQLKELSLYGNRLHDRAMSALSAAFQSGAAPFLTHLHLGHNAIGDAGVVSFAKALSDGNLARLASLLLFQNTFTHEGAVALAHAAEGGALAALTCLSLSGNAIGDDGLKALADACADDEILPILSELHLRDVGASAEGGVAALAAVLMPSKGGLPALRSLVLDEAHIEYPLVQEVYNARTGHGGVHALKILAE
jgi:Ran GTPase-activating protein (RanGAP) involved in mRNA processing and transport